MKKPYLQLTLKEREKILKLLFLKKGIGEIARLLDRAPSTISRELKSNQTKERKHYLPHLAHKRTLEKRKKRGIRGRLKSSFVRNYVKKKLKKGWSPEQISGRLFKRKRISISHEAIYQYVYARCFRDGYGRPILEDLRGCLRRKHKVRMRKNPLFRRLEQGIIKDRVGIDKRPKYIEKRRQLGHFEGDSLESSKSKVKLNTLVERVSGKVKIQKILNGTAKETARATIGYFRLLPKQKRRTLTLDNGKENALHKEITEKTKVRCFFARPYHSWERGTNENTNGLIRCYLPKGTDFAKVGLKEIKKIEYLLNRRPRKRLNYQTPEEIFK